MLRWMTAGESHGPALVAVVDGLPSGIEITTAVVARDLARRRLGYGYWSLSAYMKAKVKNAVEFVGTYETAVAEEARRRGVDGIVCGHNHKAEMRLIDGVLYCNDGDWVESCTALVEHFDGKLEIVHWMELRAFDPLTRELRPALPVAG